MWIDVRENDKIIGNHMIICESDTITRVNGPYDNEGKYDHMRYECNIR